MANRLKNEKSPYLLQHAENPVDWYPWGEDAFERARAEDKPLFLSIGYSTCHWCHVMAHESFENPSIAALLNEKFIPVKVDREERPDVDRVYMTALQAMGESGGWPLTMFLTPSLRPFYGGTYFPPEQRYGRIGLPELLQRIDLVWHTERDKVEESGNSIATFLQEVSHAADGSTMPGSDVLHKCFDQCRGSYDPAYGGFGSGAKFPRPVTLEFLLRYYHRTGKPEAVEMVQKTLNAMASSGMRDHIGGGFHRYAVDPEWRVPHFEKMLYDQAQLINVYLNAYLVAHDPIFAEVIHSTAEYLLRDLRDKGGAFYSAEDADSSKPEKPSEHGEGAFYLWTKKEVIEVLGERDGRIFALRYGIDEAGNATVDPQQEFLGKNIPYGADDSSAIAKVAGLTETEVESILDRSREKLLHRRSTRPRPLRDEKIVAAWNGLTIGALARAGSALGNRGYVDTAKEAATFVLTNLKDDATGRLYRRYKDGEARFEGQLEDYAFVVQGLIDLFESSGETKWLVAARELLEKALGLFLDEAHGGFFETTGEDRTVIARMKEHYDGAEPSGNTVAVMNLIRLASLLGKGQWRDLAEKSLRAFSSLLQEQSVALPGMISALDRFIGPSSEIVVVGGQEERQTGALLQEVWRRYLPQTVLVPFDPKDAEAKRELNELAGMLTRVDGRPALYLCENFACKLPLTEISDASIALDGLARR